MTDEPTTIGYSSVGESFLKSLVEQKIFRQQADAFRFLIAYGIFKQAEPPEVKNRSTFLNIGTLDPQRDLYFAVKLSKSLRDGESVYRHAEKLADWAVHNIRHIYDGSEFNLIALIDEVNSSRL